MYISRGTHYGILRHCHFIRRRHSVEMAQRSSSKAIPMAHSCQYSTQRHLLCPNELEYEKQAIWALNCCRGCFTNINYRLAARRCVCRIYHSRCIDSHHHIWDLYHDHTLRFSDLPRKRASVDGRPEMATNSGLSTAVLPISTIQRRRGAIECSISPDANCTAFQILLRGNGRP